MLMVVLWRYSWVAMYRPYRSSTDFLSHVPGWMFLLGGMALIGLTVLVKPWVQCDQLRRQHDLMQAQAHSLGRQQEAYQRFYSMLQSRDPVLLQRLAYHYLSLKPVGVVVLNGFADGPGSATPGGSADWDGPVLRFGFGPEPSDTVESWLHRPVPDALPSLPETQTRLVRLTSGSQRFVVIGAGLLCLAGAFLSCGRWTDEAA